MPSTDLPDGFRPVSGLHDAKLTGEFIFKKDVVLGLTPIPSQEQQEPG